MLKLPSPIRRFLRFDTSSWVIGILMGGWWFGMTAFHLFLAAYLVILGWTLLWLLAWMESKTIQKMRPNNRRLNRNPSAKKRFHIWLWGGSSVIVIIGVVAVCTTYSQQRIFALSQFKGVLYPAHDPDPTTVCSGIQESALRFDFGGTTLVENKDYASIVTLGDEERHQYKPLLAIKRLPEGNVALIAHIFGEDGKEIIDIDQNTFEINRNAIFDSLSAPRTDLSTIMLRDSYGNVLKIHYANKRWVVFSGSYI